MSVTVITKKFVPPEICRGEILRYAGVKCRDEQLDCLLDGCIEESEKCFEYKVCYCVLPVNVGGDLCDFGAFCARSHNLATALDGCSSVLIFCATVGVETDRLIAKYERIAPSKAVMVQAIGSERVESLCDAFCDAFSRENGVKLKPRFSAGYGDLPLETQRDIFKTLSCEKNIGVFLNDRFFMSPSKSVTAFVGIE